MATCGRLLFRLILPAALLAAAACAASIAAFAQQAAEPSPEIDVVGTSLRVRLPDGSVRQGAELAGAILVIAAGSATLRLRIAGVEKDARDPQGEVLLYDIQVVTSNGEEPLCLPDPDGRRLGLPLKGRSNSEGMLSAGAANDFEFVCTSGAQGKCVRFGYAPWRQTPDGRSMLDWYNTCVRLVRADYCGDGRPNTRDGTPIDLYDSIGVQKPDNDPKMSFEAAWGPGGSVCVARTRIPELTTLDGLASVCPRLVGKLGPDVCDENAPGGLIVNRSR